MALIAKGAKRPSSSFRPVLLPLQPLHLTYGGETEIRTLKAAEWGGGQVMPTGDALLAGCYLNELLLRLLARDDSHPSLFDAYSVAVQVLGSAHGEALQPALRAFELILLREIGMLPSLDMQTLTLAPLAAQQRYVLVPDGGLRLAEIGDAASLLGAQWAMLQQAMGADMPFGTTLNACAQVLSELKPQLRQLLSHHSGVGHLRTRQFMIDLHALQ